MGGGEVGAGWVGGWGAGRARGTEGFGADELGDLFEGAGCWFLLEGGIVKGFYTAGDLPISGSRGVWEVGTLGSLEISVGFMSSEVLSSEPSVDSPSFSS